MLSGIYLIQFCPLYFEISMTNFETEISIFCVSSYMFSTIMR